ESLCRIPLAFREGQKSPKQLVDESDYASHRFQITREMIVGYLALHPTLLEEWQVWSFDKRTNEGWYLQLDSERSIVGWFSSASGSAEVARFSSQAEAVAEFVLREADHIAGIRAR